ncbi:sigma-70 family RNA polymerase sigma factor [Clostridium thermobutyricum]|uniref:sigma-70 family RNA polymerase sigma factor n=1 Tax=Clostridium thermobutyricum TaxID=29372 RepID=UPI0018A886B8|nr:sigma-70 family RNA polymerase sigma factor [Clostridium thermobutyricum]
MDNPLKQMELALEKELINGAKAGNKKCLEKLIQNYKGFIFKEILKFKLNQEQIEEAYNVCVLGLLEALNKFETNKDVKFYTFAQFDMRKELNKFIKFECSIKKRVIYKKRYEKEQKSCIELKNIDECLNVKSKETDDFINIENKVFLNQILKKLNNEDRQLLELTYYKDKNHSEIAEELQSTIVKVKSRKYQILNFIRREVEAKR